jgi:hypothetical protein
MRQAALGWVERKSIISTEWRLLLTMETRFDTMVALTVSFGRLSQKGDVYVTKLDNLSRIQGSAATHCLYSSLLENA